MIEAVLFDYGGVLTTLGQTGSLKQEIADHFGATSPEIDISDLEKQWQLGAIEPGAFFEEVNRRYPSQKPFTEQLFLSGKDEAAARSEKMFSLAETLRSSNIRTGILSNTVAIAAERLRETGCYDGFDPVILSCEVGMVKPDPRIYELALKQMSLEAENVIFVDDDPKNLEPARKMGIFTVHAFSETQLISALPAMIADKNSTDIKNET
jgi:putative hydrolase of the HAD superfamily